MIIPANQEIALRLSEIPLQLRSVLKNIDHILDETINDDIICFKVFSNELNFLMPTRSQKNGGYRLVDLINKFWTYDKHDPYGKQMVATIEKHESIGEYVKIKISPTTSNLDRGYLFEASKLKFKEKENMI